MLPILGVSTSYLLVDMVLAIIAIVIGFFAAIWYVRTTSDSTNLSSEAENIPSEEKIREAEAAANEAERASMAAMQLQDLATNVASDVGEHNSVIAGISENLSEANSSGQSTNDAVLQAVAQIMSANEKLQNRLAEAESKIQAQAEELQTTQSEARTDALIKLPNRRAFDAAMKDNLDKFVERGNPFSLIIFDVDHFKQFNDTHGHQAGDEVLRKVGSTLSSVVKNEDIPCRYGGEEFALVMPNTKVEQAKIAAERVRNAIEEMEVPFEGKELRVTASLGVAEVVRSEKAAALVRRSDDAVYSSKEGGRNRTSWHDGIRCRDINDSGAPKVAPQAPEEVPVAPAEVSSKKQISFKDLPDQAIFADELRRRISESHRFGVSLSVMHLHVKGYDQLEKEYGDAVGTLLLDTVSQFINSRLREMDLLGKVSNGEFVVMLPGSSEREASLVGNRVQTAIANCVVPLGDKPLRLELDLGVTGVNPDDEASTMLARAKQVSQQSAQLPEEETAIN